MRYLNIQTNSVWIFLLLSCFSFFSIASAYGDDLTTLKQEIQGLQKRVNDLEQEIAALKAKSQSTGPSVKGLPDSTLSCAEPERNNGVAAEKIHASVSRSEINKFRDDIPKMLSAARVVPYFRNGLSQGIRFFSIREGSIYEKVGIKNGDILIAIDGKGTCDADSLFSLPFFRSSAPDESKLIIERYKLPVEISIHIK